MVVVPDLLDQLRSTFSPSSNITYDQRFEHYKTAEMLILDDLGTESATPWAKEKLYQLINYRYVARLPTVITTSISLNELDARISSRMLDSNLSTGIYIQAPAFYASQRREPGRERPRLK
jgi:DNA replication protein DnaC